MTGNGEYLQFYRQWTVEDSQNGMCAKSLHRQWNFLAWTPGCWPWKYGGACHLNTQGCRQGGGGWSPPPQILTHVTLLQKNIEKQERKKQLSGYKHAVLHTKIEAQKCPNIRILLSLRATNSLATLYIGRLSVLFLWTCSIVQSNLLCCCT